MIDYLWKTTRESVHKSKKKLSRKSCWSHRKRCWEKDQPAAKVPLSVLCVNKNSFRLHVRRPGRGGMANRYATSFSRDVAEKRDHAAAKVPLSVLCVDKNNTDWTNNIVQYRLSPHCTICLIPSAFTPESIRDKIYKILAYYINHIGIIFNCRSGDRASAEAHLAYFAMKSCEEFLKMVFSCRVGDQAAEDEGG